MNQTPLPIVSVIVPVYNEIDNVDLMYHELLEALQSQQRSFEIVLVDDGSTDQTGVLLKKYFPLSEKCKIITHHTNKNLDGFLFSPTPGGVPVQHISPGYKVMQWLI